MSGKGDAAQAWDDLLAIMKTTPIELPPGWAEEVSVRWGSQAKALILRVPMGTRAQWLEKMFLPVARVFYRQLQEGGELVVEYDKGAVGEDLRLKAERGAYEHVVHPEKLVPVSIYMFQHWLPVLEPSSFWVVIAMRQVAFVSRAEAAQVGKRISLRDLARWVPMHYSSVRRAILRDSFLSWFFTESKEAFEDLPPEYTVYVDYPLAPHHLSWIESYLQKGLGEGRSLDWILKELLERTQEIRSVKHGDVDYNPDLGEERHTVLDLAARYRSEDLDKHTHDLALQLNREITRDYLTVSIPHYFLNRFGDELSANEAALIWYLRSLYLDESQDRHFFQGYTSLAGRVGFGRKTLKRMFARCTGEETEEGKTHPFRSPIYNPELTLGNWLQVKYHTSSSNGRGREYSIAVRNSEPIHPGDEEKYLQMVEKEIDTLVGQTETPSDHIETGEWAVEGQSETPPSQNETQIPQPPRQSETGSRQVETPPGHLETDEERSETTPARSATDPGQSEPTPSQDETSGKDKAQHLNSLHTNIPFKPISKESDNESIQPRQVDKVIESDHPSGGGDVDWEKLLGFAGYSRREKESLLPILLKQEKMFFGWLIRNHLTKADFPIRLAMKNIQEGNEPESKYMSLAELGWKKVVKLLMSDYFWLDGGVGDFDQIQKIIGELRETGLLGLMRDVLRVEVEEKEMKRYLSSNKAHGGEKHILDKYIKAWDHIKGILQREMAKGDFDTWVKDVDLVDADGNTFILVAQNEYARDWLEQRLQPKIEKMLTPQVFGDSDESVKVKFVSVDELEVELK